MTTQTGVLRADIPCRQVRAKRRTLVIIPAKDEEASLPRLLDELRMQHAPGDTLVIDDGSEDATADVARRSGCRVLQHPVNLGYGASLQTGYLFALRRDYDLVLQMDADGQHPPPAICDLLAPILAGEAEVVIGSRYMADGGYRSSWLRRLAARPIAWIASWWMGQRITDPTSGFQALTKDALSELCSDGFPDDYPDVDVLISLHRAGHRLKEIAVRMRPRLSGTSMHRGLPVLYYFYRLLFCLVLLPIRRRSLYRRRRRANRRARGGANETGTGA